MKAGDKKKALKNESLEEAIISLYLNVKIRKQEEIENFDSDSLEEEKNKLRQTSPFVIIDYIKSSIEILIDLKIQEKLESLKNPSQSQDHTINDEDEINDYEKLLRKAEGENRTHIKIEHQMKLHSESLQSRIEDLEKHKDEYKLKYKQATEQLKKISNPANDERKDQEIQNLKLEILQINQILKSYEDNNLKMSELEKKLRNQNIKHEKEIKAIDDKYKDKTRLMAKKLAKYEDIIKTTSQPNVNKNPSSKTNRMDDDDLDRVNVKKLLIDQYKENSPDMLRMNGRISNPNKMGSTTISNVSITRQRTSSISQDKKKDNKETSKVDQYKQMLEKKINDTLRSKLENSNRLQNRINNKSMLNDDHSGLDFSNTKEKLNDLSNDFGLGARNISSHKKTERCDSMSKGADSSRSLLSKLNTKQSKTNSAKLISLEKNKSNSISKNIHAMKDSQLKKTGTPGKDLTPNNLKSIASGSNILVNNHGVPYYNNINIFTNNMNNFKSNDINLRQYIYNKANKSKNSTTKLNDTNHGRSSSSIGNI